MQDAHLAETEQTLIPIHPQHEQRQRRKQQFEGGEGLDGGTSEPRGNPQGASSSSTLRGGQFHNGKPGGAHGSLHHLRNGGDFGLLERIAENGREV